MVKKHLNEHISTTIFHFLLKKVLETYQVYYTILFIPFEFIFILSRFSVSLKSLNNYFFRTFPYKSLLNRFSVLINYYMWSLNHFSTSSCFPRFSGFRFFRVQIFQGPGFSGSRFFWVQVFQGPGPRSGSRFQKQPSQVTIIILNWVKHSYSLWVSLNPGQSCWKLIRGI